MIVKITHKKYIKRRTHRDEALNAAKQAGRLKKQQKAGLNDI